tara:strand:- start:106 stop:927 length:822 start_codon:yes stop_codon:yes gene_type:complete
MSELATVSAEQEREIARSLGLVEETTDRIPVLKLNYSEEDDFERPLKKGTFVLMGQEEPVYAESVKFKPIAQFYQWLDFDIEESKLVNKTVMIPHFGKEARDQKGGIRCGKPSSKYLAEHPEEKPLYKSITCFRMLYGIVEYTGKTADGDEVTVGPIGCVIRLKGANFMGFGRQVVDKLPKNKNIYNYECNITSIKKKEGSVIYYVMDFETDFLSPVGLDTDTVDAMKVVMEYVEAENTQVNRDYEEALREKAVADSVDGNIQEALAGDLANG